MDYPQECLCGRTFSQVNALSNHRRTCKKSKTRLSSTLAYAQENWKRKKARLNNLVTKLPMGESALNCTSLTTVEATDTDMYDGTTGTSQDVEMARKSVEMEMEIQEVVDPRPIAERKASRLRIKPKRYQDPPPESAPGFIPPITEPASTETHSNDLLKPIQSSSSFAEDSTLPARSTRGHVCPSMQQLVKSPQNIFGLSRTYFGHAPDHDPEQNILPNDLVDSFSHEPLEPPPDLVMDIQNFHPYPNRNSYLLGHWYWCDGSQKSQQSFNNLISIIGDPKFNTADIRNTKWSKINSALVLDEPTNLSPDAEGEWEDEEAGWVKTPVTIGVPFTQRAKNPGPKNYTIPGFYHRSLVSVIKEKLGNVKDHQHFHYEPFELHWQSKGGNPEDLRVYGELYSSSEFIKAHTELQECPRDPECNLQRVVLALMFWSDTTHLTSFGKAQLWPLYMGFGNESKYRRGRPSLHLLNHVAYFEKLPDAFKDFASEHTGGKGPSNAFFTHCHRELLHAQWSILLDDEFMEAYCHGLVFICCDGITRRFYPRIFTYSADYPEKTLLASIRNMGGRPCPRCLIPLGQVHNLGMPKDRKDRISHARVDTVYRRSLIDASRNSIYENNRPVNSKLVEDRLKDHSYVPIKNAFSKRLGSTPGFNMFDMFVVDLMHEFELGVWKGLFIHLMRLLQAINPTQRYELDKRYRLMPTFGKDTIRRFSANSSEMKKLAAHDFEDLLQCAMPVFEGLLPEPHNKIVLDLLFLMAHWHGLAKLRIHTDLTLTHLDKVTTELGEQLRVFKRRTCSAYKTGELPRETAARKRRKARPKTKTHSKPEAQLTKPKPIPTMETPTLQPKPKTKRKLKEFNLNTYKTHSLGDYVNMIRRYGTTDSYSTEVGELEHKTPKARYKRTSRKLFLKQITSIERREARLRSLRGQHFPKAEDVIHTQDFEPHHNMGKSQNEYYHIGTFLANNSADPAVKNFLPKLKEHLLPRLKGLLGKEGILNNTDEANNPTGQDRLFFVADKIYKHRILRINYTTYDVRRSQDVINPNSTHHDIMVLSDDEDQPFLFARVLGIFHVNVVFATGTESVNYQPRRLEFLWVRWFQSLEWSSTEWTSRRLHHLHFPLLESDGAFGFLDPADVVRGCHVLPRLSLGRTDENQRGVSKCGKDHDDWRMYCVNKFVDRDMVMCFHWGLGIGHIYSHQSHSEKNEENDQDDQNSDPDDEAIYKSTEDLLIPGDEDNEGEEDEDEDDADYGSALGMEDRENDDWMDSDSDPNEDGDDDDDDDTEFLEHYDMYGL